MCRGLVVEHKFWIQRWESNQIGFHQADYSPYLNLYWDKVVSDTSSKVFVPMAGKTKDMIWLANRGHAVLGVELSEIAVKAFFEENEFTATQQYVGQFTQYSAENINFLCGDFFLLEKQNLEDVSAVFDRASLVAMPPEMRGQYAEHLATILTSGVNVLLVSMEYPEGEMAGPPFCVNEKNINQLFEENFSIELLESNDVLKDNDHLKSRGLSSMVEKVYHLVRK